MSEDILCDLLGVFASGQNREKIVHVNIWKMHVKFPSFCTCFKKILIELDLGILSCTFIYKYIEWMQQN